MQLYPFDRAAVSIKEIVEYFTALKRRITERQVRGWLEERVRARWHNQQVRYTSWAYDAKEGRLTWQRLKQRVWVIRRVAEYTEQPEKDVYNWVTERARENGHAMEIEVAPKVFDVVEDEEPYEKRS